MAEETTISDHDKLRTLAGLIGNQQRLHSQFATTTSTMLRFCLDEIAADPARHRLRGFESWGEARKIREQNVRRRRFAMQWINWFVDKLAEEGSELKLADLKGAPEPSGDLTERASE